MINVLSIVSNGYLKNNPAFAYSDGYLYNPDIVGPLITPSGGDGSLSFNNRNFVKRNNDLAIKQLKLDDEDIDLIIKIFLECR